MKSYYTTVLFFTPSRIFPHEYEPFAPKRRRVRSISAEKRVMADAAKWKLELPQGRNRGQLYRTNTLCAVLVDSGIGLVWYVVGKFGLLGGGCRAPVYGRSSAQA